MFGFDIIKSIVSGVMEPLASIFNKRQDVSLEKYKVDGIVNVEMMHADVALIQAQKELVALSLQNIGFRIAQYWFMYPTGIWFSLVMYDSTFREFLPKGWTWRVLDPPPGVWQIMLVVVGYMFLHTVTQTWRKR